MIYRQDESGCVCDNTGFAWRALSGGLCALALIVIVLCASVSHASATECPNEAVRVQQGEAALELPDCRAYEMVSPNGSEPYFGYEPLSSASGDRFAYLSFDPYPGTDSPSLFLLSTRGAAGWSTQAVVPSQGSFETARNFGCTPGVYYSAELNLEVLADGWREEEHGGEEGTMCEGDDPPLVPGEPRDVSNLFLRNNEVVSYQLLDQPPVGVAARNAYLKDATPDLSHVVFDEEAKLLPGAPAGLALYEWSAGGLRLVTVLPDGTPVEGVLASRYGEREGGGGEGSVTHEMSANGERVFFSAQGELYARLNAAQEPSASGACNEPGKACTVQVDAAAPGAPEAGGGGLFLDASEDGSRVFFTDERRLTEDAKAAAGAPDLYEYDVETGGLVDLTASASEPADVEGYAASSGDGSYLYFLASADLTGGEVNSAGAKATGGALNLYLEHAGATTFIATLSDVATLNEYGRRGYRFRASANGEFLVFLSSGRLTGVDNEGFPEVYLYDADTSQLSCASCATNGVPQAGAAELRLPGHAMLVVGAPEHLQRNVTDEGRVFFESSDPLLPQVTNGAENVYEYEDGTVSLISPGSAVGGSRFLEASPSGSDVFFETAQGLVQADTDNGLSVYDARVDGGFPAVPGEGGEAPACESAEACKPPASEAPAEPFPASAAFSGPGNLAAPPAEVKVPPLEKPVVRGLTRAQRLARALKQCKREPMRKRGSCRAQARRRYGTKATKSRIGGRR